MAEELLQQETIDGATVGRLVQQGLDLRIEHMPGKAPWLLQNHAPVFGVGVVAKVRTLVDETLALRIHHDAERVTVAAERGARIHITEIRRISLPRD